MRNKKTAIYSGRGTKGFVPLLEKALRILKLSYRRLNEEEIRENLSGFGILIMPGGRTEKYVKILTANKSYESIRKFIFQGGKYIGICAGAYLASKECPVVKKGKETRLQGLGITEAKCERQSLKRDSGRLRKIRLEKRFLTNGLPCELEIWYQNGPKIISQKEIIAYYEDGSGAISFSRYGKGKVILFSPHPEGDLKGEINPQKIGTLSLLENAIYY